MSEQSNKQCEIETKSSSISPIGCEKKDEEQITEQFNDINTSNDPTEVNDNDDSVIEIDSSPEKRPNDKENDSEIECFAEATETGQKVIQDDVFNNETNEIIDLNLSQSTEQISPIETEKSPSRDIQDLDVPCNTSEHESINIYDSFETTDIHLNEPTNAIHENTDAKECDGNITETTIDPNKKTINVEREPNLNESLDLCESSNELFEISGKAIESLEIDEKTCESFEMDKKANETVEIAAKRIESIENCGETSEIGIGKTIADPILIESIILSDGDDDNDEEIVKNEKELANDFDKGTNLKTAETEQSVNDAKQDYDAEMLAIGSEITHTEVETTQTNKELEISVSKTDELEISEPIELITENSNETNNENDKVIAFNIDSFQKSIVECNENELELLPKVEASPLSTIERRKSVENEKNLEVAAGEDINDQVKVTPVLKTIAEKSPLPLPSDTSNEITQFEGADTDRSEMDTKASDILFDLLKETALNDTVASDLPKQSTQLSNDTIQSQQPMNEDSMQENVLSDEKMDCGDAMESSAETKEMKNLNTGGRECLNVECRSKNREFFEAPEFILNHFHINRRQKAIYVCEACFGEAIEKHGELCAALEDQQPLFLKSISQYPDLVEILDSDEEDSDDTKAMTNQKAISTFDEETISMLEDSLEETIANTLERVNIKQQMDWNRQILSSTMKKQYKDSLDILENIKDLQKVADRLYAETFSVKTSFIEELPSLDTVTGKQLQISDATYPPAGKFEYSEINKNTLYYCVRKRVTSSWVPCKFVEKWETPDETLYKVTFLRPTKGVLTKTVPLNHMAYGKPANCRLTVGTRVIALFNQSMVSSSTESQNVNYFPGIIAEPMRDYNKWRYLIFFDDGYAQYVLHEDVRIVCKYSEQVWKDVEVSAREFIESYLKQFTSTRPMVQVRKGQRMTTECNGQWYSAIVNAIDGSLVQMFFDEIKRYEWIYRGSTRLGPLYRKNHQNDRNAIPPKRNEPSIEYILIDDDMEVKTTSVPPPEKPQQKPAQQQRTFPAQAARDTPQQKQQREEKRAVAKKSTTQPQPQPQPRPTVQHMNNSTIYVDEDNKPKGKVVYYTAKKHIQMKKFVNHECGPNCLFPITHNLSSYSPLSKPLLSGWERQICKSKVKKSVVYRAPCGRRLRNMAELHKYLRITKCTLNVENFDYDFLIHCLAEYVIDTCIVQKSDISEGTENMVVPCVNYYDTTFPPPCKYSAKRIPTQDVHLNLNDEFMCGCDCTDDCLDKTKCQCWQLTLAGARFGNPYTPIDGVGYEYKRLPDPVPTGIYECNSRCKCKSNCLNRVVQQPLQMKLQVFKTGNRGWGLRCLNDVPKGSFICCYAGNLLTEQHANEAGENLGDEYFAELDYIEVVESLKKDYEPDVINDDFDSSADDEDFDAEAESRDRNDDSDDEFVSNYAIDDESRIKTRYRTRNSVDTRRKNEATTTKSVVKPVVKRSRNSSSDDEDEERQAINFMPSNSMPFDKEAEGGRYKSIRKFFGKDESVYIMDAKKTGNIGRYFNHSCAPNLFVQNVFVDTHDLRFPWVAFFALSHIRAGTELTWNYNYDVGSVPGKVLYCQCGADNCRGRLL